MDATIRVCNSNQHPNEGKLYNLLSAGNEQSEKEQLEERLIKLTKMIRKLPDSQIFLS